MIKDDFMVRELTGFINALKQVKPIYDYLRIMDPVNKMVYEIRDGKLMPCAKKCFKAWGKNKICDNCIGLRAIKDNDSYVKIENIVDISYMLTAIPVISPEHQLVLEVLKDITKSLFITGLGSDCAQYNAEEAAAKSCQPNEVYSLINNLIVKDGLTDIFNRRYLNEKLPVEIINAQVNKTPLTVIMADIDFFRKVNNTYGHLAGDTVLRRVAQIFDECAGKASGWAARYGGEEFFICLPNAGLSEALQTVEKMRDAIEKEIISYKNYNLRLTASFGVAEMAASLKFSADELIDAADKNLYAAKKGGRNRIVANS